MNRYIDADKLQGRIVASPLFSSFGEDGWFIKDFVIDLIGKQPTANVVDTEIAEGYRKMFEDCAEDRAKLTEENERLRDRNRACIYLSDDETREYCVEGICPVRVTPNQMKADTVREFAERVKDCIHPDADHSGYELRDIVDQIAKEMLED